MGNRYRFVQPETVRLYLVDVHRRAQQQFIADEGPKAQAGDAAAQQAYRLKLAELDTAIVQAEQDGDWIDVKAELNAGETRKIFTLLVKDMKVGQTAELDPELVGSTKIQQYMLGWSFTDRQGSPVPFSMAALMNLDTESYREISQAVDWHDAEVEKRRAERKNVRTAETSSAPI